MNPHDSTAAREKRIAGPIVAPGVLSLLFAVAVVLVARRAAHGFPPPLTGLPAILAALGMCAVGLSIVALLPRAVRELPLRIARADSSRRRSHTVAQGGGQDGLAAISAALFQIPPLLTGMALLPSRVIGTIAAIVLLLVLGGYSAFRLMGGTSLQCLGCRLWTFVSDRKKSRDEEPRGDSQTERDMSVVSGESSRMSLLDAAVTDEFDEEAGLTQWLRRRVIDGVETVEGGLLVEFLAHEKQAVVHAAFVPPLSRLPAVEFHIAEGDPAVRLKLGTAQPWGIRFDARRSAAIDEPTCILVAFTARAAVETGLRESETESRAARTEPLSHGFPTNRPA